MIRRFALTCALVLLALPALAPAQSNADVDAAARSVVRVVVTNEANDGEVGMGSGVAVTPTRIVTNAHVVENAVENGGFVGIVPSEGRKRYEGKVIAYAPDIDLAIIEISNGRIEPATLFGGPVADGSAVAALGYPYGVDRAMASGIDELIRPQAPVKSLGHVGGRRTNDRYDTVLHDANIGRGNSGGPLVDACGRVIGINSFLSVSEGIDSPFAFALSVHELASFLAKSKVTPTIVTAPCLSEGDLSARSGALSQAEAEAQALEARRAAAEQARAATEKQKLRDDIAGERDNGMALAAVLLVLGALAGVGAIVLLGDRRRTDKRLAWGALAVAVVLALAAIVVFLGRPKMSEVDDRYARLHPAKAVPVLGAGGGCRSQALHDRPRPQRREAVEDRRCPARLARRRLRQWQDPIWRECRHMEPHLRAERRGDGDDPELRPGKVALCGRALPDGCRCDGAGPRHPGALQEQCLHRRPGPAPVGRRHGKRDPGRPAGATERAAGLHLPHATGWLRSGPKVTSDPRTAANLSPDRSPGTTNRARGKRINERKSSIAGASRQR